MRRPTASGATQFPGRHIPVVTALLADLSGANGALPVPPPSPAPEPDITHRLLCLRPIMHPRVRLVLNDQSARMRAIWVM